jgi:hypothetical protein
VTVAVSVGEGVIVAVGEMVGVELAVGVTVSVGDAVLVGVSVGEEVSVAVAVIVGEGVSVAVGVVDGVSVGVAVGVSVGVIVAVAVAVGVVVAVGDTVAVGVGCGTKHTSTKTCVVRTSFDVATWCRTPASSVAMSLHSQGRLVAGLLMYVVVASEYVVVVDKGTPLKNVNEPSRRSCEVAEFPLPAATERLMMCTLSEVIGSLCTPGSSSAYTSVRGPSTVLSGLHTYEVSPSSTWAHCQFSVHPEGTFCVCTVARPLGRRIRQFGGGVGLAGATDASAATDNTTRPAHLLALLRMVCPLSA